jgi:NADPH:quinone reductase-like Zn-dependent oxidoreductase
VGVAGDVATVAAACAASLAAFEDGRVKPLLWQTFPLSRIREAQTVFMARQFVGKLVMQPDRMWTPLNQGLPRS